MRFAAIAAFSILALSACGGGEQSSSAPPAQDFLERQ